jgi:lipopolysaccharide export system protein LptA
MTLEGSAQVTSTLSDAKGVLQRLMHLDAETIQFFQPTPTTRKLVIPVPGRMLFVDNRAPAPGSTPAKEAATDPMGVRGRTAFQWGKSLVYDGAKEQVTMSGTVQMARVDPTADQVEPMRLVGDTLVADLEPQTASTTQPAPAAGIGDISSKMQLRKVHVEGDVVVTGKQLNIEAQSMDYDPVAHLMTARGSPRKPVRQLDANGLETARFDRFVWNTVKSQIVDSENAVFINRK